MRRILLPALLLLLCVLPLSAQYGRYGSYGSRDARATVARWYERFLGRAPDPYAGGWVDALQSGQDPEQVLAGILGSDEYYRRAGGTPERFIRRLYLDLTGRTPTPGEMGYWARRVYLRNRDDIAHAILTRNAQNWDDLDRDWSDRYDYRRPSSRYR